MKNQSRIRRSTATGIAALLLLAACGDDDTASPATEAEPAPSGEEAAAPVKLQSTGAVRIENGRVVDLFEPDPQQTGVQPQPLVVLDQETSAAIVEQPVDLVARLQGVEGVAVGPQVVGLVKVHGHEQVRQALEGDVGRSGGDEASWRSSDVVENRCDIS